MQPDRPYTEMLETLGCLDPDLAESAREVLARADPPIAIEAVRLLVDETIWGIEREESFGRAIAAGFLKLFEAQKIDMFSRYRDLTRSGGDRGTTVGRLLAIHLVPVLIHGGPSILDHFLEAINVMGLKGTYTLLQPLEALSELVESKDQKSAAVFLQILIHAFDADLNYNQCQHLSQSLPQAARVFNPAKRHWQLEQLLRVIREDVHLCDDLLSGMDNGLQLLSHTALREFVTKAFEIKGKNAQSTRFFLALESQQGRDTYTELQVAVSLRELQPQLNRYLKARTGLSIAVRPASIIPGLATQKIANLMETCSDGAFIYLPDELMVFDRKTENTALYKCLVRFEIGCHEFGTFEFDLDRLQDRCLGDQIAQGAFDNIAIQEPLNDTSDVRSDLERFFLLFPVPELAADLFTIFEHGRIRCLLGRRYPGLIRAYLPILQQEGCQPEGLLAALYTVIALDLPISESFNLSSDQRPLVENIAVAFEEKTGAMTCPVETSAEMVLRTYRQVALEYETETGGGGTDGGNSRLKTPFNRRLRPDLVIAARMAVDRRAHSIQKALENRGYKAYRADIRKYLELNKGEVHLEDLATIIGRSNAESGSGDTSNYPLDGKLRKLLGGDSAGLNGSVAVEDGEAVGSMTWYREWDNQLGDYLNDHACVRDRRVAGCEDPFYRHTLNRHRGLVNRIRYSFELLKPEGLKLCRQWIEGDEFDYRALLDFILDKRAGRTPSERLYLKRLKEIREVAVLLLVDLSRSTANNAAGSTDRVLDVEKEAIVLLGEALEVVGDTYAIAGFSGTGRLGVDYYHIKDFDEPMNMAVQQRISAMMPQRNTRMGAAIRHAATQFDAITSRVRLLIVLGDGYPNDLNYKKDYAIEDTRQAISELRSQHIHVHAITVNINPADDGRFDPLYGEIHHNVIANVLELPEKLWRIYGAITR
jgi:hypothetical protein